jgi:glycosyltransferase involved in cell wall biosynthesis
MLNNKTVAVVVPAYNEEKQICMVIETMPEFVDRIIIVNDNSNDKTADKVLKYLQTEFNKSELVLHKKELKRNHYNKAEIILDEMNVNELNLFSPSAVINSDACKDRIILINQVKNCGNGKAVARGLKWVKDNCLDVCAIMDGDGQMDPCELQSIIEPIIKDNIDYVKGNRLIHPTSWIIMPRLRFIGNSILSILNKLASGYWKISDTQTGYVALSNKAINSIKLFDIYKSYGWPNDLLVKMNIAFCTIREVGIKPVYDLGETSKMKLFKVIPRISWLLFKSFFKRLWIKYFFKDFHPLFILYHLAFIIGLVWFPYLLKVAGILIRNENASFETLLAFTFLGVTFIQFLLFAMWMDLQDNERLYK